MNFSDAAKLSRLSRIKLEAEMNEYAEKYRPKILEQRQEKGYTYTRYEAGHADGCACQQPVRPKGNRGAYDL